MYNSPGPINVAYTLASKMGHITEKITDGEITLDASVHA